MRRFVSIWFLFLFAIPVVAQDVTFEASVDKNPVAVGDQFSLSLVINNAGTSGGKNLRLPDLSKFHMMGGPNQSTSMQFVNGAVSSSVTYTYILQPKETGKFTIGSAIVEVNSKEYRTNPIMLEVVKGSSRPKQQASNGNDVGELIGDNLFLRATVDRSHIMQGEQLNLTFKLYTRISVANYTVSKNPSMTGFWGEDIETPKNIALSTETVNGKSYRVGIIKRMALFPTQSGTLEISPMEIQTTVQVQDRRFNDPFDAFFRDPFGRTVNYVVKSDPIRIRVDPLPAGAPPSFKGAVGKFSMRTSLDKENATTNEPISFKIIVSGTGNIKLLESPEIELPKDFEQYTPKVTDNVNKQEQRVSGSKTFEYLLIPRYPGEKTIKPVTFSYFDLGKREYVTLQSRPITLTVAQGAGSTAPFVSTAPRGDVQLLNQDIRFIKVAHTGFSRLGEYTYSSGTFLVLFVLPLLGLAGAFVYTRKRKAVMLDEAGYRTKRAIRVAQKGLKRAEQLLNSADGKAGGNTSARLEFYSEVSRAVWKYLSDRLNISQADLSVERTLAELANRSVNGEISRILQSLLESCEMARFAPTSLNAGSMQHTYNEAKRVIVDIERTLKAR